MFKYFLIIMLDNGIGTVNLDMSSMTQCEVQKEYYETVTDNKVKCVSIIMSKVKI